MQTRVTFAIQTYLNDVLIPVVHRIWQCAERENLAWKIVVNQDDTRSEITSEWLRILQPLGENATLLRSNNIHELRAYNIMARMFAADYVVFLQDDDLPPESCDWLRRGLQAFVDDDRAGAVGMRVGVLANDRSTTSEFCHPTTKTQIRYVAQVDLAPLLVRSEAFLQIGGFDTSHTAVGLPGIGMDFFLSCQLWKHSWHVVHVPMRDDEFRFRVLSKELLARSSASVPGRSVRNSQSGRRDIQARRIRAVMQRTFGNETGCFSNQATTLNAERFASCTTPAPSLSFAAAAGTSTDHKLKPRFRPSRAAFGDSCSWPLPSEIRGCNSFTVERLVGMYASWDKCAAFPQPVADNELVEVTRLLFPGAKWKEGLSIGWLGNHSGLAKPVPLGCWFFMAPGSGIYLNVTRTIAVRSREELYTRWKLPPRPHTNGVHDSHICTAARRRGYQTVQISQRVGLGALDSRSQQPWGKWNDSEGMSPPELLLCDDDCVRTESITACPTSTVLQHKSLEDGQLRPCACNDESPLLNCGLKESPQDPCAGKKGGSSGTRRAGSLDVAGVSIKKAQPNAQYLDLSTCVARIIDELKQKAPPLQVPFAQAVLQVTHRVTCSVLERLARARMQLGSMHHVLYLAQTSPDEDWVKDPKSVADVATLRKVLGGSRVSVFCLLQLKHRWPQYFGSRLPPWSFSREPNATSSSMFNVSVWYWKQCDVPALWWGAANLLSKSGTDAQSSGYWYMEHDVEWSGSLTSLLAGYEDSHHVAPVECSATSVAWSHFRERNHLNRTSVFATLGYVTRLSRQLLEMLVAQLKAGRQHAYCELRACSHARLNGFKTRGLRPSTIGIDRFDGNECSRAMVQEHERSGQVKLFHPCKWD